MDVGSWTITTQLNIWALVNITDEQVSTATTSTATTAFNNNNNNT